LEEFWNESKCEIKVSILLHLVNILRIPTQTRVTHAHSHTSLITGGYHMAKPTS